MNEYENKIELINYLNVLWKRKWLIIIATFLLISAAAVVSFLMPPKWEVDAIIEPSKYYYRNIDGIWQEMQFTKSSWIINTINREVYNERIAAELKLNLKDLPKLKVEKLEDTYLIRIYIEEKDVEKAKLVMHSLLNNLKKIFDQSADIRIKRFDSQVKSKETEKLILEKKIKANKNKINIIKKRKQETEKEIIDMKGKKEELEKELRLILEKKNRSESENFTMLHYSNEIYQSSINYSVLNESLGNKKIEEEIINLGIENNERLIDQIEKEINSLKSGILNTHYAKIAKEPTSSISPVYPKKLTNVLIAGILGLLIFGMLAFFLEYIEKQKSKPKT